MIGWLRRWQSGHETAPFYLGVRAIGAIVTHAPPLDLRKSRFEPLLTEFLNTCQK
jgi:hypothetical protein